MDNLFVTFEIAKLLKEKGFDEPCFAYYVVKLDGIALRLIWEERLVNTIKNSEEFNLTAPSYQQVIDFFRNEHNIEISNPAIRFKDKGKFYGGHVKYIEWEFGKSYGSNYRNYYDALINGIEAAIKMI